MFHVQQDTITKLEVSHLDLLPVKIDQLALIVQQELQHLLLVWLAIIVH